MPNFADDWITTGWSHGPDGKWIELGHSAAVKSYPPAELPELPIHAVTDWLNAHDKPVPANPPSSGVSDAPGWTPGPWTVDDTEAFIEGYGDCWEVESPEIARGMTTVHESIGVATRKQDAYLIAAALDLYAALETIYRKSWAGCADITHADEEAARLALAKARGEKP